MSDLTSQLIEQVRVAYDAEHPLRIAGGDTKSFLGRQTQGDVLSLKEHRGIISYQPVELVLTARAGTPISEIEEALAEHNQMLSFEPPSFAGRATLGGTFAANLSGPSRPWSGSVRDMVLGVKLISGRAELLNFGGQVMKNVAGYDVSRAQAGALGALGVMTEISLKVMPKPQAQCSLSLRIEQGDAIVLMNQLAATPKPLISASWFDGMLYLRLAGASSSVEQCASLWCRDHGFNLFDQGESYWQSLREYSHGFFHRAEVLWRFSVGPTAQPFALQEQTLLDWGGAQRWIVGDLDMAQLEQIAEEAGGTVQCWRGGDRSAEVNHRQSIVMQQLQQRLMRSLDPKNICNPARLYSWL